ncbi:MAG: TrmH family RNA methyltransferase [Lachnospiraceae bacterium]
MITSTKNTQIKNVIQLMKSSKARKEQGIFVAEGRKMFEEAPKERIEKVFVTEAAAEVCREGLESVDSEIVSEQVFHQMSDTITPQGILTLVRQSAYTAEELLFPSAEGAQSTPFVLLLENLQDPGNLGTILRTAEAAGVTGVLLTRECVDVYNPKTIRATMGSVYRLPFAVVTEMEHVLQCCKQQNIRTYAAHLEGTQAYTQADYTLPTAFMIGNEGSGLSDALAAQADQWIRIPMQGQVESLNAAMAAGILMYETSRQRT